MQPTSPSSWWGNVTPGKSPAQLEISGVPEAGNALTGLLVLAPADYEF